MMQKSGILPVLIFLILPVCLHAAIPWTVEDWEARLKSADPNGEVVFVNEIEVKGETHLLYMVKDKTDKFGDTSYGLSVQVEPESGEIRDYLFIFYRYDEERESSRRNPSNDELNRLTQLVAEKDSPFPDRDGTTLFHWKPREGLDRDIEFYDIAGTNGVLLGFYDEPEKLFEFRVLKKDVEEKNELWELVRMGRIEARGAADGPPSGLEECRARWPYLEDGSRTSGFRNGEYAFGLPDIELREEGMHDPYILAHTGGGNEEVRRIELKALDSSGFFTMYGSPGWEGMNVMLREVTGGYGYAGRGEWERSRLKTETAKGLVLRFGITEAEARARVGDETSWFLIPGLEEYMLTRAVYRIGEHEAVHWYVEPVDTESLSSGELLPGDSPSPPKRAGAKGTMAGAGVAAERNADGAEPAEDVSVVKFPWKLNAWLRHWESLREQGMAPLVNKGKNEDGFETREYTVLPGEKHGRMVTLVVESDPDSGRIPRYQLYVYEIDEKGEIDTSVEDPIPTLTEINSFLALLGEKGYADEEQFGASRFSETHAEDVMLATSSLYDVPGTDAVLGFYRDPLRNRGVCLVRQMHPDTKKTLLEAARRKTVEAAEGDRPPLTIEECQERWQSPGFLKEPLDGTPGFVLYGFTLPGVHTKGDSIALLGVVTDEEKREILGFMFKIFDARQFDGRTIPLLDPQWEEMNAMLRMVTGGTAYKDRGEMTANLAETQTPTELAKELGIPEKEMNRTPLGDAEYFTIPGLEEYRLGKITYSQPGTGHVHWILRRPGIDGNPVGFFVPGASPKKTPPKSDSGPE